MKSHKPPRSNSYVLSTKPTAIKRYLTTAFIFLLGCLIVTAGLIDIKANPSSGAVLITTGIIVLAFGVYYISVLTKRYAAVEVGEKSLKLISTNRSSLILPWENLKGGGYITDSMGNTFLALMVNSSRNLKMKRLTLQDKVLFDIIEDVNSSWLTKLPDYPKLKNSKVILIRLDYISKKQAQEFLQALSRHLER